MQIEGLLVKLEWVFSLHQQLQVNHQGQQLGVRFIIKERQDRHSIAFLKHKRKSGIVNQEDLSHLAVLNNPEIFGKEVAHLDTVLSVKPEKSPLRIHKLVNNRIRVRLLRCRKDTDLKAHFLTLLEAVGQMWPHIAPDQLGQHTH